MPVIVGRISSKHSLYRMEKSRVTAGKALTEENGSMLRGRWMQVMSDLHEQQVTRHVGVGGEEILHTA